MYKRQAYINRDYFWPGFATSLRKDEAPVPFLQPRVMGGGSSVMGMIALRGLPSDYDHWERMGARNWGWQDVLPAFQAMTDDLDEAAPNRNARGPNIVRRLPRKSWPLYMHRIEQAAAARGTASHPNIYDTAEDGFFGTPLSQDDERATSARCYLTAQVRAVSYTHLCLLASAAIRLASTANPSPPTRSAAIHASTTRSNTRRKIPLSRKRSLRARENAE